MPDHRTARGNFSVLLMPSTVCAVLAFTMRMAAQQASGPAPPPAAPSMPPGVTAGEKIETAHLAIVTGVGAILPSGARAPVPLPRRTLVTLFVDVTPKPKMHVYAPGQKDYNPISLTMGTHAAVETFPPRFPTAEKLLFKPLNEMQLVYSKPFRIIQNISVLFGNAATLALKGTLRYQACDDAICYVPVNVPLTWTIRVR